MKGKGIIYTEFAYLIGILLLAIGTAFMEKANLGMSMVVAPAYLFYLKISETVEWFTFGMAEYCFQLLLIIVCSLIMRKFKLTYLFSFLTAVFYGFVLDGCMFFADMFAFETWPLRIVAYLVGLVLCATGVSFLFHTYIAPEAYEMIVKEVSSKLKKDIHKVKTAYDCISCIVAVIMSFAFFGFGTFEGVKIGTIACAAVNGWLIGLISKGLESRFEFKDGLRKNAGN